MKVPPVKVVFDEDACKEVLDRIKDCLTSGMLAQGKYVKEFEDKWAQYVGVKHAVAVSNGSSAIEVAMRILNVQGKEVLVSRLLGGVEIEYRPEPTRVGEFQYFRRLINSSKAYIELGWEPKIDLEEGVKRTIGWYKANLDTLQADVSKQEIP